jgi:hypothetical protein
MSAVQRTEPAPALADGPQLIAPPPEQLPDTNIVESPPVPYQQATASAPAEHAVPMPPDHPAPFEHPVPTPVEAPVQAAPPAIEYPPIVAAEPEPTPAPVANDAPEPQPPAADPERHEY